MKKSLFILATAAIALASCNNDVKIAENKTLDDANEIALRPLVPRVMRAPAAADMDASAIQSAGFRVTATKTSDASTIYFNNVDYSYDGTANYTSATKYYWPSEYNLDFYAYTPISSVLVGSDKQIVPWNTSTSAYDADSYKVFKVTPDEAAANQVDLVYARTNDWGKCDASDDSHEIDGTPTGVTINFRHTESKVRIKLYNSNSNINVIVRDASICNVKTSGIFTFADANTDGQNTGAGTVLSSSTWTASGNGNYKVTDQSNTKYNGTSSGSAVQVGSEDWILIPQTFTYATAYSGDNANDPFNGPCIKINLKIKNNATGTPGAYIVGADDDALDDDDNEGYVTAMWPLAANPAAGTGWEKGKQYTYTVNLAGGGYYEKNYTGDSGLDPILASAEIIFVSVSVDNWATDISGGTYNTNLP